MKTKLIIPEHLESEVQERIKSKFKPIELTEVKWDGVDCFYECDTEEEINFYQFEHLFVLAKNKKRGDFIFAGISGNKIRIHHGHLNSGTYPNQLVIIPDHLKNNLPERKGVEFVIRWKLAQFEPKPPSPNTFDNVMFMGKAECGRDLFTVWNDNCPAVTLSYLGYLNDGYIEQ